MIILPNKVCDFERQASEILACAFDHSYDQSVGYWIDRCKKDTAQLWNIDGLWALSEVIDGKQKRVFHMIAAAGEYNELLIAEMENWAQSVGCQVAIFEGRKGWLKRLPSYRLKSVTLEKEL